VSIGNLLEIKHFANRSRNDKVIAIVRVAHFFDSRCTRNNCIDSDEQVSNQTEISDLTFDCFTEFENTSSRLLELGTAM